MSRLEVAGKTVVEACFLPDGSAQLSTVYDLAAAVGLDDQPVRLAIRRMEASGILTQVGRGRLGNLVLTETGASRERADASYLELARAQDDGEPTWDGLWRLFTFSVPETLRAQRDLLRASLVRLGAASVANAVYVSPYDLRSELVEVSPQTLERYLVVAEVTRLDGPGLGDSRAIAETLWPAGQIIAAYDGLVEALARANALDLDAPEPKRLACALVLAQALTAAMERDPLIPPELRGEGWSPPSTRREFRAAWDRLRLSLPDVSLFRAYDSF